LLGIRATGQGAALRNTVPHAPKVASKQGKKEEWLQPGQQKGPDAAELQPGEPTGAEPLWQRDDAGLIVQSVASGEHSVA